MWDQRKPQQSLKERDALRVGNEPSPPQERRYLPPAGSGGVGSTAEPSPGPSLSLPAHLPACPPACLQCPPFVPIQHKQASDRAGNLTWGARKALSCEPGCKRDTYGRPARCAQRRHVLGDMYTCTDVTAHTSTTLSWSRPGPAGTALILRRSQGPTILSYLPIICWPGLDPLESCAHMVQGTPAQNTVNSSATNQLGGTASSGPQFLYF